MKKILFGLALMGTMMSAAHAAPITYTTLGVATPVENFNSLLSTPEAGTSATVPAGFEFFERSADNTAPAGDQLYRVQNGSSNAGTTYSFGAIGDTDRAFGSAGSAGNPLAFFGFGFTNNTGTTLTSLTVNYTGEQWRNGGNTTQQILNFQYRTGGLATDSILTTTGTTAYTDFDALDFASPINTATAGALDGNLAANRTVFNGITITPAVSIADGETFFFRWNDVNDAGNDHGFGIDDFSFSGSGAAVAAVPEPSTYALFAIGMIGFAVAMRRKKAAEAATAKVESGSALLPC